MSDIDDTLECVVSMQRFHQKEKIITASCTFKIKTSGRSIRFASSDENSELLCKLAGKLIDPKHDHWFTPGIYIGGEFVISRTNYISSDSDVMYFSSRVSLDIGDRDMSPIREYYNMIKKLSQIDTSFNVIYRKSNGNEEKKYINIEKHLFSHLEGLQKDMIHLGIENK